MLSQISQILGKHNISISSFLQKQDIQKENCAVLLFSTHACKEKEIQNALKELGALEFVETKPAMIRIEA